MEVSYKKNGRPISRECVYLPCILKTPIKTV